MYSCFSALYLVRQVYDRTRYYRTGTLITAALNRNWLRTKHYRIALRHSEVFELPGGDSYSSGSQSSSRSPSWVPVKALRLMSTSEAQLFQS